MNKKKIIIICSAILALLIILFFTWLFFKKNKIESDTKNINLVSESSAPEFLTIEEKNKLNIPVDLKIQAVTRNQAGELMVYKVIKNDQDIVNPTKINSATQLIK